jgi:hypothetical protein
MPAKQNLREYTYFFDSGAYDTPTGGETNGEFQQRSMLKEVGCPEQFAVISSHFRSYLRYDTM